MTEPLKFEDVKRMLLKIAYRFYQKHGGDIGELIQEAYTGFSKASQNPKAATGKTTFIHKCVWNHLQRYIWQQHVRCGRKGVNVWAFPSDEIHEAFPVSVERSFMGELSEDAKNVIALVTGKYLGEDPPPTNRPLKTRKSLFAFLRECGWTIPRITETFQEIRMAIA